MSEFININDFKINELQAGKLYTVYYELTDNELNNKQELGNIINALWDNFIYNPSLDSNIHLDRQNKLITITTKLKDNSIIKTSYDTLKATVNILGQAVTNIVLNITGKNPTAVTVEPLLIKKLVDTSIKGKDLYINAWETQLETGQKVQDTIIETISQTPVIKTIVDNTGNFVNSVNETFETTNKILPYLPYILTGALILVIISYGNLSNITKATKKLFKEDNND